MNNYKFRGRDLETKEWRFGFYWSIGGQHFIRKTDLQSTDYEVDPLTVGMFTGLLDKNGKEIFEGDVVEWHKDSRIEIKYHQG